MEALSDFNNAYPIPEIRNYLFVAERKKNGHETTHTYKKKQSIGELLATGRLRKTSRSSSQAATLDLQRFVDIKDISLK